jgi:hypothetical protein
MEAPNEAGEISRPMVADVSAKPAYTAPLAKSPNYFGQCEAASMGK